MTSTTQKIDKKAIYEDIKNSIYVIDDLVPAWLHEAAKEKILHYPLKFGHRGLGPSQGYQFWSEQWGDSANTDVKTAPWELWAIWLVLNENKKLIAPTVGPIQCNQIQVNLTTKKHVGGLHVDVQTEAPAYTMVYFLHGEAGMEFWSNNPEHLNPRLAEMSHGVTKGLVTEGEVAEELEKTKDIARQNDGFRSKDATWYEDDYANHDGEMDSYKFHSVPWKEGRMVIFPSMYIHQGLPPKEVSPRITVGYIFSGQATPFMKEHKVLHPIFEDEWTNAFSDLDKIRKLRNG
ncbi:MAG: hypothetical protein CMA31_01000 [Euryarchaeota archaeon]|nr:hypothetical protein [Euryarchaeota archaeon]